MAEEPGDVLVRLYFSHRDTPHTTVCLEGAYYFQQGCHLADLFVSLDQTEYAFPVDVPL